jgi:lysyl-tRNA synthetase class I
MRTDTPIYATTYAEVLSRYADQHAVTIATGATCAYLGDERNLREFLVADEIARWLRRAGHIVTFLLINDSMDALNFRQLRVAVNKDPALIERYQNWCGKPIAHLPDPWGCHESL